MKDVLKVCNKISTLGVLIGRNIKDHFNYSNSHLESGQTTKFETDSKCFAEICGLTLY